MPVAKRIIREIRLTIEAAIPALIFVFLVFTFAYQSFDIPSQSMQPTMEVGDRIVVSKFAYGYSRWSIPYGLGGVLPESQGRLLGGKIRAGDVVVFRHPFQPREFIKRVIGLPGDKIEVRDGRLIINDKMLDRQFLGTRRLIRYEKGSSFDSPVAYQEYIETLPDGRSHYIYELNDQSDLDNFGPIIVEPNHIFVMGDSRDNSEDSRAPGGPGMVALERVEGKAETTLFTLYKCRGKNEGYDCGKPRWLKPFTYRPGTLKAPATALNAPENTSNSPNPLLSTQ